MKQILLFIYMGSILCMGSISLKAKSRETFHAHQVSFITTLFHEQRYFDVIAETQRLQHYEPQLAHDPDYLYFIETNYFLGKQYLTIIDRIPDATQDNINITTHVPLTLLRAEAYYRSGYPSISLELLSRLDYTALPPLYRKELIVRSTEILLASYEFETASSFLASYQSLQDTDPFMDALYNDLSLYTEIEQKSKALAVGLSTLLPGSGQLYCGRYTDALISFIAVAATSYTAYYCYRHDEKALAYTSGFFGILFYAGNMYGAYHSALSYNTARNREFRNRLQQKYIPAYDPAQFINEGKIFK